MSDYSTETPSVSDKELEVIFDNIGIEDKDSNIEIQYETASLGVCGEVLDRTTKYDRNSRIQSRTKRMRFKAPRSQEEREALEIVRSCFKGKKSLKDDDIKKILEDNGLETKFNLISIIRSYLSEKNKLAKKAK